jgi:hypothetical protein
MLIGWLFIPFGICHNLEPYDVNRLALHTIWHLSQPRKLLTIYAILFQKKKNS